MHQSGLQKKPFRLIYKHGMIVMMMFKQKTKTRILMEKNLFKNPKIIVIKVKINIQVKIVIEIFKK